MDPLASITVLAATEKIDEPSTQVVFFIVGGALAAIAVLLALAGLMRPEFPRRRGAAGVVMVVFAVLVAATMFSSAYLAS